MSAKRTALILLVFTVLSAFGAGYFLGSLQRPDLPPEGVMNEELGKPQRVDFSLFWQAWNALEEKYVESEKIDYKEMVYGAIEGMVSSLSDPYTVYMPPRESEIFKEDASGEFQGVGMEIGLRDGQLTVISPLEGTPADRAGLKAGDKILEINGTSTQGIATEEAVKVIRGPKGTEVVFTIYREGWPEAKEFAIVRDVIEIPSVSWESKESGIAYIQIYHFSEKAELAFREAASEILAGENDKIILDLRNNPGGYLEISQYIAGWFLEKGEVVTIEDFGDSRGQIEYKAQGPSSLLSYPVVVLINQGSASASEILAGALRDNRGAKLVGEESFGKGSVQELKELDEGSLKITIARWLTPNGSQIDQKGLEPDFKVPFTEEEFEKEQDPQLEKAIEILKEVE